MCKGSGVKRSILGEDLNVMLSAFQKKSSTLGRQIRNGTRDQNSHGRQWNMETVWIKTLDVAKQTKQSRDGTKDQKSHDRQRNMETVWRKTLDVAMSAFDRREQKVPLSTENLR